MSGTSIAAVFCEYCVVCAWPRRFHRRCARTDLHALGIPTEQEFLDPYCRHADRTSIPDWRFFLAFANFRMVATTRVYARALQGNAADARAIRYSDTARIFAAIGRRLIEESADE